MTGNLQADGVQSRQTLFVLYCPWAIQQKILPVCRFLVKLHRSAFPYAKITGEISMQSAEKSDNLSSVQAFCSITLDFFTKSRYTISKAISLL